MSQAQVPGRLLLLATCDFLSMRWSFSRLFLYSFELFRN
jgi:hypothetical protein